MVRPKIPTNEYFIVNHFAGTVTYHVENFLAKNTEEISGDIRNLLEKSDVCDLVGSLI